MRLIVLFVAGVLLGSLFDLAHGSEFLPFPPSQQQAPSRTTTFEAQFGASIARMDCNQLGQLRDDLTKRLDSATLEADRRYYARLVGAVTSQMLLLSPACQKK